jgi:nucleotide-binding universal stress UspA family protein
MVDNKDSFSETLQSVERAREEGSFRKLDQALIAKMRQSAITQAEEAARLASVFASILVPVDFSPYSAAALRYAAAIAGRFGSSVLVVHVISRESGAQDAQRRLQERGLVLPGGARAAGTPEVAETVLADIVTTQREQLYTELVQMLPPQLAAYPVELRVLVGHPFERILETAVREEIALIIMGTHGRTGLSHVVLGSIAERVTRLAPCPVLTVKATTAEEESWLQNFYATFIQPKASALGT